MRGDRLRQDGIGRPPGRVDRGLQCGDPGEVATTVLPGAPPTALRAAGAVPARPLQRHRARVTLILELLRSGQGNGLSRILIGFHFRNAVREGIEHGRHVGRLAANRFLRPVRRR